VYSGARRLGYDTSTSPATYLGVECSCYDNAIAATDVLLASDADFFADICEMSDVAVSSSHMVSNG
jgi:hypothetical protein